MKSIRIGAGLGFYGDNWEPVVASIERGGVQFIASDHLAELTLAILQKDRQRDPALGYARDVVPLLLRLWPLMRERGVRFVCNAGGLNPHGAAQAVRAAFAAKGWQARIAVVSGDDVLPRLLDASTPPEELAHLFTGAAVAQVRERLVFGNAYLGAAPIVEALGAGAEIVITGRVADAALFLGPLVHGLGWTLDGATQPQDLDRLAQGLTVGHLLECSGQGSGGNFGSQGAWKDIPDLAHIGYPIAEVWQDGTALITKAAGTGGRVNFDTVRQQLLYEVHNPHAYHSPDVVLDMGQIVLHDEGHDRVRLTGARGTAPGEQLKVVAGYRDGFKAEVTWGFSWPDAWDKAQAAIATIRTQLADKRIPHDELFVEYPGLNSAHGPLAPLPPVETLNGLNEIWTRLVLRTQSKAAADGFGRLFPWLALSGPAYTCGFTGLHNSSELLGIWPTLIPRALVEPGVRVELLGEPGPHAPPLRGSLPPEGADPAWGGPAPDRGPHAPPLRGSLPSEGADPAWGGPAPDRGPHAPPLRGSLPQNRGGTRSLPGPGADPAWGGPAPDRGPHAPPLRGSLPPEGADPAWGGPAPDRGPHAPPLRGSLPSEGADPAWGGPAPDRGPHAPPLRGSLPQNRGGTRSLPGPGADPAWGGPAPDRP